MRKLYILMMGIWLLCCQAALAQTKEVAGKVTDSRDGTPLPGVTVKVKGSTTSTVTQADGSFKFTVAQNATTVSFTYIGYRQMEMPISSLMNVTLAQGDKSLSEVVVVGYGTKIKREVTSSIARVTSKEFENLPLPSFESALQG